MLTAGTAGPEDVLADVLVADLHFGVVVGDLRRDVDCCEACLSLALGVERADSHEPVNAHLPLQIAVGPWAADRYGGALDASYRVVLPVEQFDGVVMLAGPGRIHPQHHLGPVVGIGAAVPGVDRDECIARVVRAGKECGEFEAVHEFLKPVRLLLELAFERDVFAGQFFQRLEIATDCQRFVERLQQRVEGFKLGDGGLCPARVVPEISLPHRVFQTGRGCLASLPVKESPAAEAVGPGWFRIG